MNLHFNGKTRDPLIDRNHWTDLLPRVNLKEPLAAVDLGGNSVKMLVLKPDYTLYSTREDVVNGKSIGSTGKIDDNAWHVLKKALRTIKAHLDRFQVKRENIHAVATAGLRSASNGEDILKDAIQDSGIPFKMISPAQESALIYPSTLTGEGIQPHEKMLVLEIGGGSTELAFGTGPYTMETSQVLEIGTGRLNLKHLFSFDHIEEARLAVRAAVQALPADIAQQAAHRRMFIKGSNLEDLRALHLRETGCDILETALTHQDIRGYLSKAGLAVLKNNLEGRLAHEGEMKIVAKLLIIDELMTRLGIDEIELGFDGGLKFEILREVLQQMATPPVA